MSLKLSKFLFFFLIIFAPLAFGTTEAWSYAILEIGTFTALSLFLFYSLKHGTPVCQVPGLSVMLFFLAYILFQLLPLPPIAVQWLSPQAFEAHQAIRTIFGNDLWLPLSIHPKSTLTDFFKYATYIAIYVLTIQLLVEKNLFRATAFTIAIFGGLLAFSSILQFYLTKDMALWVRHLPSNSIIMGPYVNHNHYAGLMELMFPLVLALFLFYRPRISNTGLIRGIVQMMTQEKANIHILIGTSALLIVVSIFVSLSRGAMISCCLSLMLFFILLLRRRISRGNTYLIIGVVMLSAISIGWFGWDQIFDRFARLKNAQGIIYEFRLSFWSDTINLIRHFWLTGSGIGTFSHIYPTYRTIFSDRFLTHAHNDYLELLAEGGVIGFTLAAIFFVLLFSLTFKLFKKRRDAFAIYMYMGGITALASLLFHSLTDFNLHIGANGFWFFFIAGIMVSAAGTGFRQQSPKTKLVQVKTKASKNAFFVTALILSCATLAFNLSNLLGRFYYNNVRQTIISSQTPPDVLKTAGHIAHLASVCDPLSSEYHFFQANTAWFLSDTTAARKLFSKALKLAPLDSRQLYIFATFLARHQATKSAQTAFEKSMTFNPTHPEYTFQYGAWLLQNDNINQGITLLRKVLVLDESFIDRVLTLMIINGMSAELVQQAIPEKPGPSIALANFLYDTGHTHQAIDRYLKTIDLIETRPSSASMDEKTLKRKARSNFIKIYRFFRAHNDNQNALYTLIKAEEALPQDDKIKIALANFYYSQGIFYKAAEKYDQALLINSNNPHALKMRQKINQ